VYTLTSVGYGDITAQNTTEFIVSVVVMLFGAIIWAFIVGNTCSLVSTMDVHGINFRQTMDEVRRATPPFPPAHRRALAAALAAARARPPSSDARNATPRRATPRRARRRARAAAPRRSTS
jgi:hypothetical protein